MLQDSPRGWRERYVAKGYLFRDPIVERLQWDASPFTWTESAATCQDPAKVALVGNEAAAFGLRDGFVVPVSLGHGLNGAVSFGGENADLSPDEKSLLAFIATYTLSSIFKKGIDPFDQKNPLTPRERECLLWAADGKTEWEIANILHVSKPTISKHFLSVRQKLGAVSKPHAIAIAFRKRFLR